MTLLENRMTNVEPNQAKFEQTVLEIWHAAHGVDQSEISTTWGKDRIAVLVENVLFKAEKLLAESKEGSKMVGKYVHDLMCEALNEEMNILSEIAQREIASFSVSVDPTASCLMIVFKSKA
ncbi:MAG: Na-translocating system protein MpsC family protein [Chloroflexota bacterium]